MVILELDWEACVTLLTMEEVLRHAHAADTASVTVEEGIRTPIIPDSTLLTKKLTENDSTRVARATYALHAFAVITLYLFNRGRLKRCTDGLSSALFVIMASTTAPNSITESESYLVMG